MSLVRAFAGNRMMLCNTVVLTMSGEVIETLEERGRWRARDVTYFGGRWEQVQRYIPRFKTDDFRASPDTAANPYMKVVIREPRTKVEQAVPIGTVSSSYTLAQHNDVAEKCFAGIRQAGIETKELRCELGLTELGEWMNLRIYFPDRYSHMPEDQQELALRLECFNSVDGSSRLVILLGWLRFICSNGMVIGETRTDLHDIHNKNMDLKKIPGIIGKALKFVEDDLKRFSSWENHSVQPNLLEPWINKVLCQAWNKKAACRVYHICKSGFDVEITDPFAPGDASQKPVTQAGKVPGASGPAQNLYDVSQALSWIATGRNSAEEKVEWQAAIPGLIERLRVIAPGTGGRPSG
jgi:hypothetical protein